MRTPEIINTRNHGDMALCNLSSVNLVNFRKLSDTEKDRVAYNAVKTLDLAITHGICPITEGAISNELYRYEGVGVLNAAAALALEQIEIDSPKAAEWFDEVMDDLAFRLYRSSMILATELGPFPMFRETKWAEGLTPVHLSRQFFPQAWNLTEYGKNFNFDRWEELGKDIKKYGIRNAQVMSIAPTANSGKAINATESTEPVMHLMFKEEGVKNVTALAPFIKECMHFYKPAFECDQRALITNAIVRQKYIDQAQSITLYLKRVDSLKELTTLHNYGFEHGIKTFYYLKQQKSIDTDECVACAV